MEIPSSYIFQFKHFPHFERYTEPGVLKASNGVTYYDFQSFVCSTSLWTPTINVQSQYERIPTVYEYPSKLREQVTKKLCGLVNSKKHEYQMCYASSGTDAVTNAINMARRKSGRRFVFTFSNQYHGKYGSLSGRGNVLKEQSTTNQDIIVFPSIQDYRTAFDLVSQLDALLYNSIYAKNTAAVILELIPIANGGGELLSPEVILQLKGVLEKHGVFLIVDEVQTGFWRTGRTFSFQHYKLSPDAVAFGKSIAGGLPLYGTYFKTSMIPKDLSKGFYSSTYAFSAVAGSATLQIFKKIGNQKKFEKDIEDKGVLFDYEFAADFAAENSGQYYRKGLLISMPTDKTTNYFLKKRLIVRVINGRLLLTPPLFTDENTLKKMVRRLRDVC